MRRSTPVLAASRLWPPRGTGLVEIYAWFRGGGGTNAPWFNCLPREKHPLEEHQHVENRVHLHIDVTLPSRKDVAISENGRDGGITLAKLSRSEGIPCRHPICRPNAQNSASCGGFAIPKIPWSGLEASSQGSWSLVCIDGWEIEDWTAP